MVRARGLTASEARIWETAYAAAFAAFWVNDVNKYGFTQAHKCATAHAEAAESAADDAIAALRHNRDEGNSPYDGRGAPGAVYPLRVEP